MIQNKLSFEMSIYDNLKKIPGFGKQRTDKLCYKLGINPSDKISSLSARKRDGLLRMLSEISKKTWEKPYKEQWKGEIPEIMIDTSLLEFQRQAKKKQMDLNTIRGSKLSRGLPCRGQRTKTNANTAKKRRGH